MQSKTLTVEKKAFSIETYDFLSLYTNLPHNILKNVMRKLINFYFKDGEKKFIAVTKFGATWTDKRKQSKITFDKASLKLAITFFFDKCFFDFGNFLFPKMTGIPISSDPAPFMENLFLQYYENKWLLDIKKRDLLKA